VLHTTPCRLGNIQRQAVGSSPPWLAEARLQPPAYLPPTHLPPLRPSKKLRGNTELNKQDRLTKLERLVWAPGDCFSYLPFFSRSGLSRRQTTIPLLDFEAPVREVRKRSARCSMAVLCPLWWSTAHGIESSHTKSIIGNTKPREEYWQAKLVRLGFCRAPPLIST
jgi:hypothetical protein